MQAAVTKNEKIFKIEEDIIDGAVKMSPKKRVEKEEIKTIEDEILSEKSENSSESSDTA